MRQYNFFTYILTNHDRTVLYTGVTKDLEIRLIQHYFGSDNKDSFTAKYKCFYLVWFERHQYVQHAIDKEKQIKGLSRNKKIAMIEAENKNWTFLNKEIMEWPPIDPRADSSLRSE
ncbi:GIY-YIG nuclease family protein [Mucilaginibacter sp. RS28]|uniref:GIY-YIG nuclease family protein n=1 Tax=Mucilaginibacter straminoryzae TaxID=2932774 RepID=A0A9X1X4F3_9SPHI|nr:GIY-YIG nuclease family protein [Mucilaginibacter straminoryzae]MCJ8210912.1 GIY-YIG nuclease family protein [Mucilaginibacter straminoryzae]